MQELKLTIVIATCNRHLQLKKCIDSIYSIFYIKNFISEIEIRVIDQSNEKFIYNSEYKNLYKNFFYQHVSIKNASYARNIGAKESRGEYIWFMDDDAELKDFDISVLYNGVDVFFISWKEKKKVFEINYFYNKLNLLRRSGTPFYILKKTIFYCAGSFNEILGPGSLMRGGEDLDLLIRINRLKTIKNFGCFGTLSHPLIQNDKEKKRSYYFARGYVLAINKEYLLFGINIIYDLFFCIRDGVIRPRELIKGFLLGIK